MSGCALTHADSGDAADVTCSRSMHVASAPKYILHVYSNAHFVVVSRSLYWLVLGC